MIAEAEKRPPMEPDPSAIEDLALTQSYTLGRPFQIKVAPDGKTVLFLRASADDPRADLFELDVESGRERLLASAEHLLGGRSETLSAAEKAELERKRVKTRGFSDFDLSQDGGHVLLKLSGKVYLFDREEKRAFTVELPEGVILDPRLSPKGDRIAFVRDDNLHVMGLDKRKGGGVRGKLVPITSDGTKDAPHGVAEFVAQEEMHRFQGYWWSPAGDRLLFQSNDYRGLERFTIADAARPEAEATVFPYPRAGRQNAVVSLSIASADGKKRTKVKWDRDAFPYVSRAAWPKGGSPSIVVQARDQRSQALLSIDPDTGKTTELLVEKDPAWINISDASPRWLAGGKSYLWATEDPEGDGGRWRLERHHAGKKKLRREVLLPPSACFERVAHVDEERDLVWFLGGPDPRELHLYRAKLSGGAFEQISPPDGDHAASFSTDGSTLVLTRTTIGSLPRTTVHRVDAIAGPLAPVERSAERLPNELASLAREPKARPSIEMVPPEAAGGFYAAIVRPAKFDPARRYPVILYVYGGPAHQVVRAQVATFFMHQWFADHGFVVVSIDGRGTPRRGRAFERAIRDRFGDLPLEDQVAGLTALGARYRELDLDRVGVYGWSFGGYMAALSVLRRPDVFKVGVAGAPVVDWEYYDTHYTERYLGLPADNAGAYRDANLLTYAESLERPLMLLHGIADDNVYFAHTLKLADALFRANRPFELVPLVGLTHQVADPKVRKALYLRIVHFFGQRLWS
jgi:dipeptidyl-peptidase-4